jgi:hypothetical protein
MGDVLDDRYQSWMVADPAVVLRAVDVLRAAADRIQAVAARLAGLLGSSAAGLGWKGDAALAASAAADHGAGQLRQAVDVVSDLADALRRLAGGLDEHGSALRDLKVRTAQAVQHLLDPFAPVSEMAQRQVQQLAAETSGHVDALLALDAAVAAGLAEASARLTGLSARVEEKFWDQDPRTTARSCQRNRTACRRSARSYSSAARRRPVPSEVRAVVRSSSAAASASPADDAADALAAPSSVCAPSSNAGAVSSADACTSSPRPRTCSAADRRTDVSPRNSRIQPCC